MLPYQIALVATIAFAIVAMVIVRATVVAENPLRKSKLDIQLAYAAGALLFVLMFDQTVRLVSIIEHPLLGLPFIIPLAIFLHEISRSRDVAAESLITNKYSVFRVSVLVTIAIASSAVLAKEARGKVSAAALLAACLLFPFSSSLPTTRTGALVETTQRIGLVSCTYLIVGIIGKQVLENKTKTLRIMTRNRIFA
tara:strand:+ start:746 stop:1333 length:588 start_codon:yes stop_codon:yes gene_type:complete